MSVSPPALTHPRMDDAVLILAPTANDARLTADFLRGEEIPVAICEDLPDLCRKVEAGCGALLLAEETLAGEGVQELVDTLARQPTWSDVPIAIITSGGEVSRARLQRLGIFGPGGNVTFLERPFRPATLVSTVEAALRGRRRQHEVQGLLKKLKAGEDRLLGILDSISDGFITIDRDWRITYVNPSYLKLISPLFKSAEDLLGHNLWERFSGLEDSEVGRFYQRSMAAQEPGVFELFFEPLQAWLEVRTSPSPQTLSIYVQDISERKRHEAEVADLSRTIREQARVFDQTLSNISDFAYTFDREGRFIYVNRPLLDLWGLPLEEAVGKNFHELHYPEDLANRLQQQINEVFESGRPIRDETPYTNAAGEGGFYEYIFTPVFGADGQVEVIAGSTRDITERKLQEEKVAALKREIEDQAHLFDATLSNIADLAYTFDLEGRFIYANKTILEVLGKSLPEVVGKNVFELDYPPEVARQVHGQILEVAATGQVARGETVFRDAEGVEDIHEYIFNPVFDAGDRVVAVTGTTRLVTERRRSEEAKRQLAAIVESSEDAIVSKNLNSIIVSWNRGAQKLFGYTAGEAIGQSVTMLIPEDRHDEEPSILARIRRGQPIEHYETIRRRKDGSLVDVSLSVSPIMDDQGKVVGVSKIARDISEQKRTEIALREAKEIAEAASRSKDHFLAVLSHELRTPLTPVLMTASALEMDATVPAGLRADMAMIRRNVELETKLIDDLLDLSRITTGKLSLHLRAIDLNEAVRNVCTICEQQIFEKGVRLILELGEGVGSVHADPARLQQVLWNILKNAAKFTADGGEVRVTTRSLPDGMQQVTIRDNGIGMSPEILPKIFDAFEQGDVQITRQFGGLGLGLAITKALVGLHEGNLRADSEGEGKGSTFTIELPSSVASTESEITTSGHVRRDNSLRVLVVEDHVDTAAMLGRLLGASGYTVTVVNTARAALEVAEETVFDVVVSDIGLPDATGYDFMRKLRLIREIKGIAMSGYGMEEDIRKSLDAGFTEHLIKPVNLLSLEQAIRRLASTLKARR